MCNKNDYISAVLHPKFGRCTPSTHPLISSQSLSKGEIVGPDTRDWNDETEAAWAEWERVYKDYCAWYAEECRSVGEFLRVIVPFEDLSRSAANVCDRLIGAIEQGATLRSH